MFFFFQGRTGFSLQYQNPGAEKTDPEQACRFYPPASPYWLKFSPDSSYSIYAYRHNLYLLNRQDTVPVQLTTDGEKYYSYSNQKDSDSDKNTTPNIVWAGNSKVFYCLRQDRRKVENCWVVDNLAEPRPKLRTYKFPMPGEKYVLPTICICFIRKPANILL